MFQSSPVYFAVCNRAPSREDTHSRLETRVSSFQRRDVWLWVAAKLKSCCLLFKNIKYKKQSTQLLNDMTFNSETASAFSPGSLERFTPARSQMQRHNQCRALSSVYKTRREDLKATRYIDAAGRHLSARDTVTITPRIKSVTKTQRQRKSNFKERWSTFIFVSVGGQLLTASQSLSFPNPPD